LTVALSKKSLPWA